MEKSGKTAAIGMSGGVDSSVAAWLLKEAGWRVVGVTMSIWDGTVPLADEGRAGCYGPGEARDLAAAAAAAERIGIEHRVISLAEEYKRWVLGYFREEYLAGRTPNPCVRCNQRMKFGLLPAAARAQGLEFDAFATGHYARTGRDEGTGRRELRRGADERKDQSYFLSRLGQEQLGGLVFPLGGMLKAAVEGGAGGGGWADLEEKEESQDFIECKDYGVLFGAEEGRPGEIATRDGRVVGRHRGIFRYTVGQRKGLELGGGGTPWYVLEVDAANNRVVVGPREELGSRELWARDLNWVSAAERTEGEMRCRVQIRQRHRAAEATARFDGRGWLRAEFDEAQLSVTPGQVAVCYEGDRVLVSGIIDRGPGG